MSSYEKNQAYSTEWSDDEQPATNSGNENGGGNSFEEDATSVKGVRMRALYDYDGQEQDELTFKAGLDTPPLRIWLLTCCWLGKITLIKRVFSISIRKHKSVLCG